MFICIDSVQKHWSSYFTFFIWYFIIPIALIVNEVKYLILNIFFPENLDDQV